MPRRLLLIAALLAATAASTLQQRPTAPPAIEVPYKGRTFSMASRDGVTVMIAPLERTILDYSTAQVWISNNTARSLPIAPQGFTATVESGATSAAAQDTMVLNDIRRHSSGRDIEELVRAYESMLLGLPDEKAMGYYEQRKRAALSSGGKQRAAIMANVIILPETRLRPGETIDGTLFFHQPGKVHPKVIRFTADLAGRHFEFAQ